MDEVHQISLVIVTYRDVFQWVEKQREDGEDNYALRSAILHISAMDMRALAIEDGAPVMLHNDAGEVVVRAWCDANCQQGFGYMPVSPYVNMLTSYEPSRGKLPNFKRIPVMVMPAGEDDCPLPSLMPWWRLTAKTERLQPLRVYNLLPRTNCKLCGCPTCMAFAFALIAREKRPQDCPELDSEPFRLSLQTLSDCFGGEEPVEDTGLLVRRERCNGCGDCVLICNKAISMVASPMVGVYRRQADEKEPEVLQVVDGLVKVLNWSRCKRCDEPPTACRVCEEKCPFSALELVR